MGEPPEIPMPPRPGVPESFKVLVKELQSLCLDVRVLDVEGKDEETVMEDVFDAGAEDFDMCDGVAEVTTTPAAFSDVRAALEDKGYEFISADVAMVPSTYTALSDPDDLKKMGILLDHLEDDDDVQNVWHNLENEEDLDR